MPQPPSTPFLSFRFPDESLLIDTEPIFGDVTLGDEDDWSIARPSRFTVPTTIREDKTLDLGDYLPEEDEEDGKIRVDCKAGDGEEWYDKRLTEGSDSAMRIGESVRLKRARPEGVLSSSAQNGDDLYSLRRIDSFRQSRASSAAISTLHLPSTTRPSSPVLPSLYAPSSASFSSTGTSLGLSSEDTDVGIRPVRLERIVSSERQGVRGFAASGMIQKHTTSTLHVQPDLLRSSALSRYLAKSAVLNPNLSVTSRSSSPLSTGETESGSSGTSAPRHPTVESPAKSKNQPTLPISSNDRHSPSTASPVSVKLQRDLNELRPSPTNAAPAYDESQTPVQTESSSTSKDAWRASASERVLSFFAGILGTPKSPLEADVGVSEVTNQREDIDTPHAMEPEHQAPMGKDSENREQAKPVAVTVSFVNERVIERLPRLQPVQRPHNMPAPLTRPLTRPLVTAPRQPFQPTRVLPMKSHLSKPIHKASTSSVKPGSSYRPPTTSAFTQAALARLPPPGKGATSSSAPIFISSTERAPSLPQARAVFERPHMKSDIPRTIPLHGRTPGKASRERAEHREVFDTMVRERIEERERERREMERRREEEENEQYRRRRKETVIWAKPVPGIYRAMEE